MDNKNLGRADLHIHTTYSYDGLSTPEEIVKHASEIGLDVIAIADHDEIKGALEAREVAHKYGIEVVVGEEILTNEGEMIALFIEEKITPGKTLFETAMAIKEQNGLVVIPHPFALLPIFKPAVGVRNLYSLFKEKNFKPDAIEIMNSSPAGRMSYKKGVRLNEKVFLLPEVGGSDAHIKDHVGMCVTLFKGKTKEDLRKSILEGKTSADGEFYTRKDSLRFIKGNIVKRAKKTKDNVLKPYKNLKNSFKNMFHSE